MNTVFVYGLLKPGFRYHYLAEPFLIEAQPATVKGRLYDHGVPAARFDEDGEIDGYLFRLDRIDEALKVLDDLEDEGERYRRVVVQAATSDGTVDAYAYEYLLPVHRFVGRSWA